MANKIDSELIAKAKTAKSVEELLSIVKENGIDLPEDKGRILFEELGGQGELSDDELDNVSGGGCGGDLKREGTKMICCGCGMRIYWVTNKKTGESWSECGCTGFTVGGIDLNDMQKGL